MLRRVGGYRAELPHSADMELWLRLAVFTPVCRIDADQAYKRLHPSNMQYQYQEPIAGDLFHRKATFEVLFRDHGNNIAERERLERKVQRSLSLEGFWAASEAFDRGEKTECQRLMDFALASYPELRSRPEYVRFRLKRLLGPRVWGFPRPAVSGCAIDSQRGSSSATT